MKFITLLLVAFLYPAIAFTKPLSCEVLDSKSLENGTLQSTDFSNLYIGNKFILDKETGRMLGDLQNHNSNGEPTVLDYGSDKQNYKAITVYKPYTRVELIQVTYDKNKKNQYSFLLIDGLLVISGLCDEFNSKSK